MPDDAELILVERARQGDPLAVEDLVRRTARLLFAHLFLETGDLARAEDLLQKTWLLAHRALHQLKNGQLLRPWLLSIARNVLTDDIRKRGRQKRAAPPRVAAEAMLEHPSTAPSPDEEAVQAEERDQVLDALRALPEEYRVPITLRYIAGADCASIGVQLGLTNGSLRGLLHRGLKMLRERLASPTR